MRAPRSRRLAIVRNRIIPENPPLCRTEHAAPSCTHATVAKELEGRIAADLPDLVVVLESPLGAYSQISPRIAALVAEHYVRAMTFDGVPAARASGAVYDQEDAFYTPLGGIENATRPGPNVRIFERRVQR
jgi:hypothetical protein